MCQGRFYFAWGGIAEIISRLSILINRQIGRMCLRKIHLSGDVLEFSVREPLDSIQSLICSHAACKSTCLYTPVSLVCTLLMSGAMDAANIIKPALSRGDLQASCACLPACRSRQTKQCDLGAG